MAYWSPYADWMLFERLDKNDGLKRSFTLAYKITDDADEVWSQRFVRFKQKDIAAIFPAAVLLRTAVPQLMKALDLKASDVVFLPALSSGETSATGTNVMRAVVSKVAETTGAQFDPKALRKKAHEPIHGMSKSSERSAELEKAEYSCGPLKAKTVMVFDDFITQGGTLSKIAQAIHASNLDMIVYGVALAKTERKRWDPNVSNSHVPQKWNDLWVDGEHKYAEREKAKAQ